MKTETRPAATAASQTPNLTGPRHPLVWTALLLAVILCLFFWQGFLPNKVVFGNDDPLGQMASEKLAFPSVLSGFWDDSVWFGNEGFSPSPTIDTALRMVTTPRGFMNIFYPAALFIVGICACFTFRQFKLTPLACILGGLAAALNSDFFSTACWGVATQIFGIGADYLALGLLAGTLVTHRRWIKIILAGMAVGLGVMEGYDIGAIFSLFVAAFALFQAVCLEGGISTVQKFGQGALRLALVAGFAALIAAHTLTSLIGTQIQGITGTGQDELTKRMQWEAKTQWSVPKAEIFQVFIPGVFGYRNEWHMYENQQPKDDQYWGTIGAGGGMMRLIGTGFYGGIPVVVIALWAILQSFRKRGSPFTPLQRRALWFWSSVLVATALLSFGKNAPFYQFFYALPYASTIRNPAKFMHVFSWALVIVFAYGVHGLIVAYMQNPVARAQGVLAQFKSWRARAPSFDRKWLYGCFAAIGVSLLAWLIYASSDSSLKSYVQTVGINAADAPGVVAFSIRAVGWFILFLVLTVGLLALIFSGQFTGPRACWGGILLGALLLVDLGRADRPWLIYWDTDYKYAADPIIKFLADKPYEHRVSLLPVAATSQQQALLQNAYGSEWKQHLFPYYNIQCAEVVQEPRVAVDKDQYMSVFPRNTIFNVFRFWELSNTRYILGPGADVMKQLDPEGKQFHVLKSFNFVPKRPNPSTWPVDYSAAEDPNGQLSVLEFTSALPRAKLFSNWRVNTNDDNTLHTLANPAFDVHQTVLVADSIPAPGATNTGTDAGTVEIMPNYKSKYIELNADVKTPAVLLLADRYNPKWQVWVDGKPDRLLRCNFIERGVFLQPGKHTVIFRYATSTTVFYVSLAFVVLGLLLSGYLIFTKDETEETAAPSSSIPASKPGADKTAPRLTGK